MSVKSLSARLADGDRVVCAEGYAFEMERRGYMSAGAWVPEVVLDQPHVVKTLHEEFVHAGSDIVVAFTYFGNRAKVSTIDREADVETLNRSALRLAREVATATGNLMAGNLCNTGAYDHTDLHSVDGVRASFKESIEWAVEEGCDMFIAETFFHYGEAALALECIQKYAPGKDCVISLALKNPQSRTLLDGWGVVDALRSLHEKGATVVGLNCCLGPTTISPLIAEVRAALPQVAISASPVCFSTNELTPTFYELREPDTGKICLSEGSWDICQASLNEIAFYAAQCLRSNVNFVGLCCGNYAKMTRHLCQQLGKTTMADRYKPKPSLHIFLGKAANETSVE